MSDNKKYIFDKYLNNENAGLYQNYSLRNIEKIMHALDNPHKNIKGVHIAGTNGKGSTAYMLSAILTECGYKTGLYVSPHLNIINERISIDGININDSELYFYAEQVEHALRQTDVKPTFFDMLTATAFLYFDKMHCDCVIIETGLGGRLDSTNIFNPLCTIITNVSIDHKDILGNDIKTIAKEKAGTIKPDIPVVTTNRNREVIHEIKQKCRDNNSPLLLLNRDFEIKNIKQKDTGYTFTYIMTKSNSETDYYIPFETEHQIKNASAAITCSHIIKYSFENIEEYKIYNALAHVKIPGRLEYLRGNPIIIFDPAHNVEAIQLLNNFIIKKYKDKKIILILTLMMDKDIEGILSLFKKLNFHIIYITLNDRRAYRPEKNSLWGDIPIINSFEKCLDVCKSECTEDAIFIFTGSFRLYKIAKDIAQGFNNITKKI